MEEDFLDACEGRMLDLVGLSPVHQCGTALAESKQIVVSDAEAILGIGDQVNDLLRTLRQHGLTLGGVWGYRHFISKSGDLHSRSWY
jgi:hypothetical protein